MSQCPGLIACTPVPTPGPTGLTPSEVAALGYIAGTGIGLLLMLILILLIVAATFAVFIVTK